MPGGSIINKKKVLGIIRRAMVEYRKVEMAAGSLNRIYCEARRQRQEKRNGMITSTANQQVKHLIQLQNKAKLRDEEGVFVLEGKKVYDELRKYRPQFLVMTYLSESFYKQIMENEPEYLEGIRYEILADNVFKEAAETVTPQGVLAIVKQPKYELEELLSANTSVCSDCEKGVETDCVLEESENPLRFIFLENLRDPGNLGTILRTAEGAGMTGVILSKGSVDIFNPKVIRSTMGSIFRVPFLYVEDTLATMKLLQENGVKLYAAYLSGSEEYDKVCYAKRSAIMIGNEANGLLEETAIAADVRVRIPMAGELESLNAAVAAAILMYHTRIKSF